MKKEHESGQGGWNGEAPEIKENTERWPDDERILVSRFRSVNR